MLQANVLLGSTDLSSCHQHPQRLTRSQKSYITASATNKKSLRATGFDRTLVYLIIQREKFHSYDRSVKLARAGTFQTETSIVL